MNAAKSGKLSVKLLQAYQSQQQSFVLDVDFQLPLHGVTAIFGHSGAGKTRLLRCIAGLEQAEQGVVQFGQEHWQQQDSFVAAHHRAIGYVFQQPSLFSHLSVAQNLKFAIKRAWQPVSAEFYHDVLAILAITHLLDKIPEQLSGGEQQRVAIARAILIQPKLLLMDEPLAALDIKRKREILPYLEQLTRKVNIPILYVSHSVDEIVRLADSVIVLAQGKLQQQGSVEQVFSSLDIPLTIAHGDGIIFQSKIETIDPQWQLASVLLDDQTLWLKDQNFKAGQLIRGRILARDVSITKSEPIDSSILNRLQGTVVEIVEQDQTAIALVKVKLNKQMIIAKVTRRSVAHLALKLADKVWLQIKSVALVS